MAAKPESEQRKRWGWAAMARVGRRLVTYREIEQRSECIEDSGKWVSYHWRKHLKYGEGRDRENPW